MEPMTPQTHVFVRLWEGSTAGTKGCFMDKETGRIRRLKIRGEIMDFPFVNAATVRKIGYQVIGGKARTAFLSKFGLMRDMDNMTVRRKKR